MTQIQMELLRNPLKPTESDPVRSGPDGRTDGSDYDSQLYKSAILRVPPTIEHCRVQYAHRASLPYKQISNVSGNSLRAVKSMFAQNDADNRCAIGFPKRSAAGFSKRFQDKASCLKDFRTEKVVPYITVRKRSFAPAVNFPDVTCREEFPDVKMRHLKFSKVRAGHRGTCSNENKPILHFHDS